MNTPTLRDQFKEILPVVWEVFKQHPILVIAPVTLYMYWFERDLLNGWVKDAQEALNSG